MIEKIVKNYDAFYCMVLSSTALSNSLDDEADEDISRVVQFIGESYDLKKDLIEDCKNIIVYDLCAIGTENDVAGYSAFEPDAIPKEKRVLYRIKIDALQKLQTLAKADNPMVNPLWFSYKNRRDYSPYIRFREISVTASLGDISCNRLAGIMAYLGIGTEQSESSAIRRLTQCAYWGDIPSLHLLRLIYKMNGNQEKETLFADLLRVSPYLEEGTTVLPEEAVRQISEEAKKEYAIISSIKQDIILDLNHFGIDYSFVETMLLKSIDHFTKLGYINEYRSGEWKNASNPASDPNKRIGFQIEED